MKNSIMLCVVLSVGVSLQAMYEQRPSAEEVRKFHKQVRIRSARKKLFASPVQAGPDYYRELVEEYEDVISGEKLLNARDEQGWNVLQHLASRGAGHEGVGVEFLKLQGVSCKGTLINGDMSPSFNKIVSRYKNGEYLPNGTTSSVKGLDFGAEDGDMSRTYDDGLEKFLDGEEGDVAPLKFVLSSSEVLDNNAGRTVECAPFTDILGDEEGDVVPLQLALSSPEVFDDNAGQTVGSEGEGTVVEYAPFSDIPEYAGKQSTRVNYKLWAASAVAAMGVAWLTYNKNRRGSLVKAH